MIIVDPVTLGDVACTRASPKWAFDRTGTLVQVPANTLAVTYDPSDLSKAPYALVEAAATNQIGRSDQLSDPRWVKIRSSINPNSLAGWADAIIEDTANGRHGVLQSGLMFSQGENTLSFLAAANGRNRFQVVGYGDSWALGVYTGNIETYPLGPAGMHRVSVKFPNAVAGTGTVEIWLCDSYGGENYVGDGSSGAYIVAVQLESGSVATSVIPTPGDGPVTRSADIIAPGAGLVYSNVPITEPTYNAATTYAKDAFVYDPATHNVFQSLIASNLNKALTDTTAWTPRGATNRWAMLDQYNNTQTTNADEILLVVSPQVISQGLYLGNMFADEARISVVDLTDGLVYSETASLIESTSGSSFFNWAFKRIKRKDYFGTLKLPPYANALITISLRKIGGTAKCGMAAVGPMDEFGPTLMGLSTEGKDYSSTTFNFDGTSSTVIRPYAKKMTCDVMVDNDQIDYVQSRLFDLRQKVLIWFGGPYGSTIVAGRYGSFKNVIQYATRSLMNLTIEGAV